MKSLMASLKTLLEHITVALTALITLLVGADVFLRGFNQPLIVTDEAARYLMIWIVMLAAGLASQTDEHIRIEMLPKRLSFAARKMLRILSQCLVLMFLAIFITASLIILPGMRGDRTVTLGFSMFYVYLALPVGGALMFFVTAYNTWHLLGARNESEFQPVGAQTP